MTVCIAERRLQTTHSFIYFHIFYDVSAYNPLDWHLRQEGVSRSSSEPQDGSGVVTYPLAATILGLDARLQASRTCQDETGWPPAGCKAARHWASHRTVAPAGPTLKSRSATSPFDNHRAQTFVTPKLVEPRHFPDATDRIVVFATAATLRSRDNDRPSAATAGTCDGAVIFVTHCWDFERRLLAFESCDCTYSPPGTPTCVRNTPGLPLHRHIPVGALLGGCMHVGTFHSVLVIHQNDSSD